MYFQPYDWQEVSTDTEDYVYVWAFNEQSENILIKFENLPITCYASCKNENYFIERDIKYKVVKKKPLYYYQENYDKYYELTFRSIKDMRMFVYGKKSVKMEFFEHNISPINKILAIRDISVSNWMTCNLTEVKYKSSNVKHEFIGLWKTLEKVDINTVVKPKILAYDLETYSHDHNKFPNKYYITDEIYMISCLYQEYMNPESKKNYIITRLNDEVDIEDAIIIKCDNESELLDKFFELIKETDPDIITGYNIYGFDNSYVNERLNLYRKSWPNLTRLLTGEVKINNIDWASSAYGKQELCVLEIPGRLCIDMLAVIRRDEPNLEKYSLDFIANKFINDCKNDVSAKDMFKIYKEYFIDNDPNGLENYIRVLKYCIQDSALVLKIMEKLDSWGKLLATANVMNVVPVQLFTRGQTIRCFSQVYKLSHQLDFIFIDKRDDGLDSYQGASVVKPIPGLYNHVICLDFASLYPSIIQAYNICHTTLVKQDDNNVKDEDCNIIEFDEVVTKKKNKDDSDSEDEGDDESDEDGEDECEEETGKVIHHRYRFYKNKIGLLPALVKNLVDERNKVRQEMKNVTDPVIKSAMNARQLALKVSANSMYGMLGSKYKLSLKEGAASITAKGRQLLESVIDLVKTEYNGQLVYGDTDSVMFTIPTVKNGREGVIMGDIVAQKINGVKKGEKIPGTDKCHENDIPGLFPPPLSMEFEKLMIMLSIKKKNYVAYLFNDDGTLMIDGGEKKLLTKGVPLVKKDRCKFLKHIYKDVVLSMLDGRPFTESFELCIDTFEDLLYKNYDLKDLCVYAKLGAKYKPCKKKKDGTLSLKTMQLVAERLKKKGTPLLPGSQIEYLVAKSDDKKTLKGERMFTYEEFLEDSTLEIDTEYYIDSLLNSLDELLRVGYSKELEFIENICNFKYGRWGGNFKTAPLRYVFRCYYKPCKGEKCIKPMNVYNNIIDKLNEQESLDGYNI
jgi:DNA polymerase elongation subunit (family B)